MWPCYWVLGCRCGYWIILRGWLSGLSDRHAGFYWTRCCRFEFHIGQFVACMNIAIWTNCCSKTWQTDYTQSASVSSTGSLLKRFTLHNQAGLLWTSRPLCLFVWFSHIIVPLEIYEDFHTTKNTYIIT